jgi:lambda family phage tail tape measure protein
LPAAGQTSFQGEIRQVANRETLRAIEEAKSRGKGLPGGFETTFIGGGARALKNAEFLADATGKIAARSEEAAQATSMFAEGLGQAVREAKAIADYLDQANRLRSTGEPKTQQFIRQTRERGQVLLENQRSVEIARERSAALLGEQYLLSQVPARGELLPGGRTETRQPDYRAMLNNQALIRQYVNDILQTMSKQQESAATLEQLERRTLGNVSEAVAARRSSLNVMQREVITQERINEENERSIQIIRERNKELIQRPIAAMTPGERGVIPAEGGGITLTAGNILDPATLRAERRRRIAALKARKEARGRALSEGLIGGAFPLVFGQGVGASAGGLAGGVAGGLAGGGLGFGLSLIGTALGTALDQLGAAAAETGKALRDPIAGFEKLKEAGLLASKAQEFYIQKLIESGKGAQAAVIIQSEIIKKIGVTGVNDLNRLGKSSYDLSKAWAEFNLQLQAALAGPLAGLLKWVTSIVSLANQEGRSRSAIQDVAQGLTGKKREEFLKRLSKIELGQGGIGNKVLSDLGFKLPGAISAEEANRQRNALAEEYRKFAKQIPISGGLIDPVEAEKQRQAAQQAADEIKQAYREGFALQQQAIDLERQGADLRRQVADEIFAKQQEAQRAQVEAEKLSADIKIKAIDLEYQKRINQEEGRVAELLSAEAELIRVRTSGQADIDSKRKLLELDINKQNRETQNYIRNVSVQVDNMRRQTLQYEMQAADYREQVERRINEQRIINQAGANSAAPNGRPYYGPGGAPTGGRISGGATTSRRRDPDAEATGWDIVMPGGRGASVRAPIALTITGTGFQGSGAGSSGRGYGNWISGEFALGGKKYELLLGHFDQVNVARGMQVPAGAELGKQGITGRTFGTHVTTHVNPMRGASVNDAWSALEQITQVWERGGAGGAFGNEINQLQQAQSQVRRPSIPQVDAAAIRNEALRISQQDAQIRRNILGLQNESNKLDEQAAEEKLLSVARGKKELDQLELQLDLIKNRAELTGVYLSAEREGLAPLIGLAAEYSAEVANRIKANKEYIDQAALEPALKNKVLAGMRQELARMKQKYDLQREILAITAAENTAQQAMAALRAITEQNKQLDLEIKQRQLRNSLIIQGINPAIAEGEAKILGIQTLYAEAIAKVNTELNESVRVALEKNGVNADLIDSTFDLSEATIAGLIATQQDTDKQKALRDELERILKLKNALKEGIGKAAGDATGSTRESAKKQAEPGQKIQDYIAQATAELYDLEAMAVRISQSIGDAIGNSLASGITGLIEGTTTAKEIFANFLKDIGQILLQEGAKMIGTYIAIGIAKQFAGLFSGGGGSGYSAAKDFQMPGSAFIPKGGFKFPGAANGAYFSNGIAAFANGGMFSNSIVSSPTLFKFADGGAMRTGVMGEAGPEAIMPLERGSDGRLGVRATGMQDALQRYSTRQQQASEAKGGPGTDNTEGEVGSSVVDVRYNVERINNVDYVTADEFRTGMREAVAQGARQGERQTLRRLQQSSSARKRIGI